MKGALRGLLRRLGVELVRYAPRNFPHLRRPQLLGQEAITLVVDVGASDGAWAEGLRRSGYSGRIASFEPHSASYALLEQRARADPRWTCRRVAVGERQGRGELRVSGNGQSSSLLAMRELHLRHEPRSAVVGAEQVETERLDDLLVELVGPQDRLFLKLDVQGLELQALRGASRTLTATRALEVELSAVPLYEGQGLLPEVCSLLYGSGFELIGFETSFRDRATGDLLQANGLFRRVDAREGR